MIYGDPMSKYLEDLAAILLKDEPILLSELKFYILKSNIANAFITSDGSIFFTSGLIAQMVSESDLAFVLSHEISHYTEQHNVNAFKNRKDVLNNGRNVNKQIKDLSTYSQKNEFEADEKGILRYLKAGYTKENLSQVFDILMYSHLPIDEIKVEKSMIASNLAFIPDSYLISTAFNIDTQEDYDDEYQSHPNIEKRKENLQSILKENSTYSGNQTNLLGESRFEEIRRMARYERIRNWLYVKQYVKCIYEIAILTNYYGENRYLDISRAQAWYGLLLASKQKKLKKCYTAPKKSEGKITELNIIFENLLPKDIEVLAVRNITDLRKKHPKHAYLNSLYDNALSHLVSSDFRLTDYSNLTFEDQIKAIASANLNAEQNTDKLIDFESEEYKKLSKYEKIKLKEKITRINSDSQLYKKGQTIDTTDFRFYALSDLVSQGILDNFYKKSKEKDTTFSNSDLEQEKRPQLREIKSVAIIEPYINVVNRYKNKDERDVEKTLALEKEVSSAFTSYENKFDVKVRQFTKEGEGCQETEGFNAKSALLRLLQQQSTKNSQEILVVDYEFFNHLSTTEKTDHIIFPYVKLIVNEFSLAFLPLCAILPLSVIIVPAIVAFYNQTEFGFITFDSKTNRFLVRQDENYNRKPRKMMIQAKLYEVIKSLEYHE